ncbi:small cell adhesion glycoprotein isoform X2 [Lemur catta]|uniref:small cell adhesion glycoprotein isoform X2 n=1 Tax=Lemur catta TaxID=9447 RepID=UPI001E2689BA|nr:small cell adhesion glycoprotein isoform X2 [Lemur catta]
MYLLSELPFQASGHRPLCLGVPRSVSLGRPVQASALSPRFPPRSTSKARAEWRRPFPGSPSNWKDLPLPRGLQPLAAMSSLLATPPPEGPGRHWAPLGLCGKAPQHHWPLLAQTLQTTADELMLLVLDGNLNVPGTRWESYSPCAGHTGL